MRDFLQFSNLVASKSTFSYEFSYEPLNLLLHLGGVVLLPFSTAAISLSRGFVWQFVYSCIWPQNRCFARGFRQFSSHLTKCHACHGICALSPLDAALTMRSAKSTQHDMSEVLRLPCKMTMDMSKVLRLPGKLQLILRKRRESIAPATQNDFRKVTKHVSMSRSAMPATRNAAMRRWKHPKVTPFAELTIGPSALTNGCELLRTVANINATSSEHTLNLQTPRVKREPLLRIREKSMSRSHVNPCQTGDARNFFAQ